MMFKKLFQALISQQQKNQPKNDIALHLAKIALYDLKGQDSLHPSVSSKYAQLEQRMRELGKPIWLSDSFRTVSQQNALSSKVTNAGGLSSYHQYGLAFDVAFVTHRWKPPSKNWWTVLGREGKKLGLTWGGDWGWDFGHFEYHPNFTWEDLRPHFLLDNLQ